MGRRGEGGNAGGDAGDAAPEQAAAAAVRPAKRARTAAPPSRKEMDAAARLEQALVRILTAAWTQGPGVCSVVSLTCSAPLLVQFGGAHTAVDALATAVGDIAHGDVSIAALVRRVRRVPVDSWPSSRHSLRERSRKSSADRASRDTSHSCCRPCQLAARLAQEARQAAQPEGQAAGDAREAGAAAARRPVWTDPSDTQLRVRVASVSRLRKLRATEEEAVVGGEQYEERLRRQHAVLNPNTAWAQPRGRKAGQEGSEGGGLAGLLASTTDALTLTTGASRGGAAAGAAALGLPLPPGELAAVRVRDGNHAAPAHSVIRSVEFHSSAPLLLAAGLDKTLRLFSVDGSRNPQVGGVHFGDMPIHKAAFGGDGQSVILSGRRPFFYVHHLTTGTSERVSGIAAVGVDDKSLESFAASPQGWAGEPLVALFADSGRIPLVSLRSRQAVATLQMAGTARCGAFGSDGHTLFTGGGDGTVCIWDLRTRRCVDKLVDSGSMGITALAASPKGAHWAAGGAMGVVNLYRHATHTRLDQGIARAGGLNAPAGGRARVIVDVASPAAAVRPQPVRSLGNLTTTVDTLAFSQDGQMMAMATRLSKDALRLVHLPSCTVFANWPSSKTPLHYVHCAAFSPNGGYLAVGNARGRVLLYRLPYYDRL